MIVEKESGEPNHAERARPMALWPIVSTSYHPCPQHLRIVACESISHCRKALHILRALFRSIDLGLPNSPSQHRKTAVLGSPKKNEARRRSNPRVAWEPVQPQWYKTSVVSQAGCTVYFYACSLDTHEGSPLNHRHIAPYTLED